MSGRPSFLGPTGEGPPWDSVVVVAFTTALFVAGVAGFPSRPRCMRSCELHVYPAAGPLSLGPADMGFRCCSRWRSSAINADGCAATVVGRSNDRTATRLVTRRRPAVLSPSAAPRFLCERKTQESPGGGAGRISARSNRLRGGLNRECNPVRSMVRAQALPAGAGSRNRSLVSASQLCMHGLFLPKAVVSSTSRPQGAGQSYLSRESRSVRGPARTRRGIENRVTNVICLPQQGLLLARPYSPAAQSATHRSRFH